MTDEAKALVDRLRDFNREPPSRDKAADRIEALEAENERLTARVADLEAVLKRCAEIVRLHNNRQNEKVDDVIYLARAALKG